MATLALRDCEICETPFLARFSGHKFCSESCRERAKYLRMRNDPDRWAAYLAAERASYTPALPRPERTCDEPGCGAKHLARGMCRKHYYSDRRQRGLDGSIRTDVVSAMVKHYDESGEFLGDLQHLRLLCKVPVGVIPLCPECRSWMALVPNDDDMVLRDCGKCRVRALLNAEEVECLISEARLTERSTRTVNSSPN